MMDETPAAKKQKPQCQDTFYQALGTGEVYFDEKQRSAKYLIFRTIKKTIYQLFEANGMRHLEDCLDFLNYLEKDLKVSSGRATLDTAISNQMVSLTLPETNQFISLLSHQNGELNEEILLAYPVIRTRSSLLLGAERKMRKDKIDLQFISDFMHDYCR
jgi:hypothetical protein